MDAVTNANSGTVGTLTLVATRAASSVVFKGGINSFNKGITIDAMGGVVLSESVAAAHSALREFQRSREQGLRGAGMALYHPVWTC